MFKDLQMVGESQTNMSYFQPLEVAGGCSRMQP